MKLGWDLSIAVAMFGAIAVCAPPAMAKKPAAAAQAEFAIRWNVNDGGPRTAEATLALLKREQDDSDRFEVRYFDFTPPADAPSGFTAILRQRTKGTKHELTFKYRGAQSLSSWRCPLSPTPDEAKNEVDISVTGCGETRRAYSSSCTVESKNSVPPPVALKAQLKRCVSTMTRLKAGKLKVEEWHLPGDTVLIEASRGGVDTVDDLEKFRGDVADPLIRAGVKPTESSKTELGGACE